jgi:flagellar hook-basal body complex protein FliE
MMSIESIAAVSGAASGVSAPEMVSLPNPAPMTETTATPAASFGQWFSTELHAVNDKLVGAERDMQKVAVGAPHNLHEVMIHMEEARLQFQLLVQVRNQLMNAYNDVMKMSV